MNKRFFTLLASAALLFSTAIAAAPAGPQKETGPLNESYLYHLLSGTEDLLYVGEGDTLFVGDTATISAANVEFFNSLWCVKAEQPGASLFPQFVFTNKGAETYLSVNIDSFVVDGKKVFPAVVSDGDVFEWKFSSKYKTSLDATPNYLASYIKDDTIAVLTTDGAGKVFVEIVEAPEGTAAPAVTNTLLTFNLASAASRVLTAAEFNTVLGTKEAGTQKLIFNPDKNKTSAQNPFSEVGLKAVDAATAGYVKFAKGSTANDTLRVDTSYVNAQGTQFLAYAFGKVAPKIAKQSEFQLVYYPSNDSLTIQVAEVRYKPTTGAWEDAPATTDLFVSVQDLVKADQIRIVTVAAEQNTHISFGIGGCSNVGDNRTTLANGLYFIKNAEGKYLAAPIYTDSSTTTLAKALWVNLEANVEPSRLPAYQWVVEKTRTSAKYAETSPIKITNREYKDIVLANSLQLITGKDVILEGVKSAFTTLSDAAKKDSLLGYKAIGLANQEYKTYVYSFNYLHQFNDQKYLEVTNDKNDTLIYVGEDKTSFELVPQSASFVNYGKTISGIAQLKRVSYKLKIKDSYKFNQAGKFVAIDFANDRYTLVNDEADASVFFLKENNYKDGKSFYALVDTTTLDIVKYHNGFVKVAIDDNNVYAKVNPITEIRTSAFAVEPNDDPLYRKIATAVDTLEFFREREPSDVLYENAHLQEGEYGLADTSINFLGVRNKTLLENDGIQRGYSFLVDTAYVNRGTGIVKPQYLVAVRPEVIAPNTTRAWFLINATQYGVDAKNVKDYQWNTKWDRLVFAEGVRKGDSLFIFQPGFSPETINFAALKSESKARLYKLGDNKHKDAVWQFRLINNITTDPTQTFLIESENQFRTSANPTPSTTGVSNYGDDVAPLVGGWVKIQNGVPVISRGFYEEAILDAEKFNVKVSGGCSNVGDNRTTLANGLYFIKNAEGKYLAAPIYTDSSTTTLAKALWVNLEANVEPSRLPAYQWVVEKTRTSAKYAETSPIKITNREYKDIVLANSLQLITGKDVILEGVKSAFTTLSDAAKKDSLLGYKAIGLANQEYKTYVYSFNYLHQFNDQKYLEVTNDKNDTLIYVGEDKTSFELVPQSASFVNYGKTISGIAQLKRVSYKLKIKDSYKFNQAGKFVAIDFANDRYTLVNDEADASVFFLKENNYKDGKSFYALVDTTTLDIVKYHNGFVKVAIDDNNVYAKVNPITEIRTSAFAVEPNDDPLYRKIATAVDTLEFFREREPSDVLYENAHLQEGEYGLADTSINFLGVRNKTLLENDGIQRGYSFLVDTAYVNRGTGIVKPQYLVAVRPEVIAPNTTRAWFLINATQYGVDAKNVKDYQWNTKWDRLVFAEGVRKGDSLFIFQPGFSPETINFAALKSESKARLYKLGDNKHKDAVWQFRLINNITTDPTQTFLIESENQFRTSANPTPSTTGVSNYGDDVAPLVGGWVKIQNGVPVISRGFYEEAILDAEKFNVKVSSEAPVANEGISATDVTVVGGAGNVTIFNAAGKKVTISNILGQAVANTVLSSDQATISVPKGVVVVAVEGEKAVKAVVK
ncbi:DUF6383 domain-containing protein [Parabacteroides sp. Marseille-P3160]|uniref:DUF6383 domain-containing protein n=1 Tax=Parabacteroides sp. Marseille-P3160 TaxID=1917887 RepID=UPI0009BA1E85|nr:DUF6383 domain-containing protein [Parabacteroides sp. Marseille-P3160]